MQAGHHPDSSSVPVGAPQGDSRGEGERPQNQHQQALKLYGYLL